MRNKHVEADQKQQVVDCGTKRAWKTDASGAAKCVPLYLCAFARLTLVYKCVTNQAAIDIPCDVHHQSSLKTRASHSLKFIPLQPSCDTYKYSFWPRTIIDWNSLTSDYLTMDSTAKFKATISDYIFSG